MYRPAAEGEGGESCHGGGADAARQIGSPASPAAARSLTARPKPIPKSLTPVLATKHKDERANIPTEELRDFVADDEKAPKRTLYPRDPWLNPQLVWKGKVQMIYLDPPHGIKFGSNWQGSTRKRNVKDGRAEDATRQPEQIRAFRDTWKLGIHSYLAYLRDRLV